MTKIINPDFPTLTSVDFPRVSHARSLQAKINGRWVTMYNYILTNWTCNDRRGTALADWPEFEMVKSNFPTDTVFRITYTQSIMPDAMGKAKARRDALAAYEKAR